MYSLAEDDIFFKKKSEDKIESGRVLKQPSSRGFPVSHEKGGIEGIVRLTCDGFVRQCRCHCASAGEAARHDGVSRRVKGTIGRNFQSRGP